MNGLYPNARSPHRQSPAKRIVSLGSRPRADLDMTGLRMATTPLSKRANSNLEIGVPSSATRAPRFNLPLNQPVSHKSFLPVRSPSASPPSKLYSPSRTRVGSELEKSPVRISRGQNPIFETPRRLISSGYRPEGIQSTTRSTMPNFSRIQAQTEDILKTLDVDRFSTSLATPSRSDRPSISLKRTFSTTSRPESSISATFPSFEDNSPTEVQRVDMAEGHMLSSKKRRKVTFDDRVSLMGNNENNNPDPTALQHTNKALLGLSPEKQNILQSRARPTESLSTHRFLEELMKRQEAKFIAQFDILQQQLEDQAQEIKQLKQEHQLLRLQLRR